MRTTICCLCAILAVRSISLAQAAGDNTVRVFPPMPRQAVVAEYTDDARAAKIEGNVLVKATVERDGTVSSASVVHSLGHGLDKNAVEAVSRARFIPAFHCYEAVPSTFTIPVSFRLNTPRPQATEPELPDGMIDIASAKKDALSRVLQVHAPYQMLGSAAMNSCPRGPSARINVGQNWVTCVYRREDLSGGSAVRTSFGFEFAEISTGQHKLRLYAGTCQYSGLECKPVPSQQPALLNLVQEDFSRSLQNLGEFYDCHVAVVQPQ